MALSQTQRSIVEKARSLGGGQQGVALTERDCEYLVAVIAKDLDLLQHFPELPNYGGPLCQDTILARDRK